MQECSAHSKCSANTGLTSLPAPRGPPEQQLLTGAYGGLYSRYLRCPFSLGLKSESSEKSEKSSLEEAWRCSDRGSELSDCRGLARWQSQPGDKPCSNVPKGSAL